jgi:small subunit ribosomal protein S9
VASTEYYGTGRRKTSTARVFLRPGKGAIVVNRQSIEACFPTETLRLVIRQPFVATETTERFDVLATRSWCMTRHSAARFARPDS